MQVVKIVLSVIYFIVCFAIIVLAMMQSKEDAGLSSTITGSSSNNFFEKNKGNYYDSLTVVRNSNNIKQWIKFFLTGIIETSQNGQDTLKNIITYKEKIDTSILQLGHKATSAKELIRYMFAKPILNIGMVREQLNCSFGKF